MTGRQNSYAHWSILFLVAAIPRLLGAFFLPNAFGDAYVYIQEIGTLSTKIAHGNFGLTDLFGFWLPLYQLIASLLNVLVKNGFYSGKIVAAIFGAGTCVFVYLATQRITENDRAAFWIFLLIALNPLHIFYSASAMTDVPHAFFVIAALYFLLTKNWIVAAIFAAFAGFTRVESWMLIALVPFVQVIRERRVSIVAIVILIIPPLFWFYISWKATGNWRACFVQRQQYHDWLLRMNPAIAHFSLINVLRDCATLLISSDIAVLLASFLAGWLVLTRFRALLTTRDNVGNIRVIFAPALFFFAFLALLTVAYVTHQQPIIFPRYGLILFTLGLPMLAWIFLRIGNQQVARRVLIGIIVVVLLDASIQFAGAVGTVNQYRAQRAVADYLRSHFDQDSGALIFCDEGTVRVLSGIPEDRFISSNAMANAVSSGSFGQGKESSAVDLSFIRSLGANQLAYVVVANVQGSLLTPAFRQDNAPELPGFEPVLHSHSSFLPTEIWLLRLQSQK